MIERHSLKKTGNEVYANLKQANKINFFKEEKKKTLSVPGNTLTTKLKENRSQLLNKTVIHSGKRHSPYPIHLFANSGAAAKSA